MPSADSSGSASVAAVRGWGAPRESRFTFPRRGLGLLFFCFFIASSGARQCLAVSSRAASGQGPAALLARPALFVWLLRGETAGHCAAAHARVAVRSALVDDEMERRTIDADLGITNLVGIHGRDEISAS